MVGKSIGFSHQCAELPACRAVRPDLAEVPSQVLQDAVKRVGLAFDGFFRRCAAGEKPGYPRYKSCLRYDSMTFKQYGNSFSLEAGPKENRGTLMLAKLGQVKMVMHRPLRGTPKTAIVKRDKASKKSQERKKLNKRVARVNERTKNRRKNFAHQQSRKIVNTNGLIAVESLVVRNLIKNPKLAKSIADAAWSQFFEFLQSKAQEAGREVIRVNPAYTSQTCSCYGHRQEMPLSVRIYECPICGLVIDRDHNGSKNILEEARAAKACGRAGCVIPEAPDL